MQTASTPSSHLRFNKAAMSGLWRQVMGERVLSRAPLGGLSGCWVAALEPVSTEA